MPSRPDVFSRKVKWGGRVLFKKLPALLAAPRGRSVRRCLACPRPARPNSPSVFAKLSQPHACCLRRQSPAAPSKRPSSACCGQRWEIPILCQHALGESQEGQLMPMLVRVPVPVWVPVAVQVPVRGSGKAKVRSA